MATEEEVSAARSRWNRLWERLGVPPPKDGTLDELLAAYGEEARHYHTFAHVLDCLEVLDRFDHLADRPHEIEAAIWFHDAVYDTRRGDNEEASAEWASRALRANGVSRDAAERVTEMILRTRHEEEPRTADEALFLDIDLSILGRNPDDFDRYEDQIRREYEWAPADAFHAARSGVLRRFLDRPRVFLTDELRSEYEDAARRNLETAVRRRTKAAACSRKA